MLEEKEWRQWDLPIQHWLQKFVGFLLLFGTLQSWNTIFIASTLGWPSLEWQVAKETKLQVTVLTIGLFTTFLLEET